MKGFSKGYTPWNKGKRMEKKKTLSKTCLCCGIKIEIFASRIKDGKGKFCSKYSCVECGAKNSNGKSIRFEADHYPIPFIFYLKEIEKITKNKSELLKVAL